MTSGRWDIEEIAAWAAAAEILSFPPPTRPVGEFRRAYATDFGRYLHRVPALVFAPVSVTQLAAAMGALGERRIPYTLRGSGHSSGGQVLIEGGVVIDMSGVRGVVDRGDMVDVFGGTSWLEVVEELHPQRRPPVLTDNLRTTVAGTLAVGGIGDTSIHEGLQIASVVELDWVAPNGSVRTLTHADEELGFVLAGRGQLGAIARVRVPVSSRSSLLAGHVAVWSSLDRYLDAAATIRRERSYDVVRSTLFWRADGTAVVRGILARIVDAEPLAGSDAAALARLASESSAVLPASERIAAQRLDPIATWTYVCPALELSVPTCGVGRAALAAIERRIISSGLHAVVPNGVAIAVVAASPTRLPLAPMPPGQDGVLLAIRPQLATPADAARWIPLLHELADLALGAGGRIYLMSIPIERSDFLERQFGAALPRLRELKRKHDPDMVCNPGLL